MNTISSIISTLSTEEKRSFVAFLKQKNKRTDTKNIELFILLEAHPNTKDIDLILYKKPAKGALHALCKRLHDTLIDFIASKSFERETSEEMEILKLLLASKIFFEQKQYKIALKTINKAEHKAKSHDLYNILNEIYYTKIQYNHISLKEPLNQLIINFKNNQKSLKQEENLNLFYAHIQNKLIEGKSDSVLAIHNSLSLFDISITNDLTYRSLFKILEITNQTANISRDFYSILPFVETTYQQIKEKKQFLDKYLFYHIQILYYVANSYFRNKNFTVSEEYLHHMNNQMIKQNKKFYKRFFPQYTLVKALNLNYTGKATEAISLLENFKFDKFKNQTTYVLDLKLTFIMILFQQKKYRESLRYYQELHHRDTWYTEKAGIIWVIKKNLIEILLHIELDHIDLVESRVKSFRKKHATHLKSKGEDRVLRFLSLTMSFYHNRDLANNKNFIFKIKNTLLKDSTEQEDIFTLSFYIWLKSKVEKTDFYKTTLEMIQQVN
ncbi:hypothetical protein ABW636_04110 [Aquimarina sp. 2201CG1-2-11]|uniref:hypothetical protein n=1 Tax=Aquimarina discodermiae TaxID=3231043 RepID=UPI0034634A30